MEVRECLSLDDILLVPKYSELNSRNDADISIENFSMPIVMSPMDNVTTPEMIKHFVDNNLLATVHRYFKSAKEQLNHVLNITNSSSTHTNSFYQNDYVGKTFFAVGSIKNCKDWIDYLFEHGVHNFLVDMAHSDCKLGIETVRYIKKVQKVQEDNPRLGQYKYVTNIMAGNVATKSAFERLQSAGANYIRVGIGCGSICSTRLNTGFGVPQYTAIKDCASRKDKDTYLVADGGIKYNGDITKAIASGADFVMLGKMLASTDLGGGECFDKNKELVDMEYIHHDYKENGKQVIKYKGYHGMASKKAREGILSNASIEGVSGLIPYTGKTEDILDDIKLNLKASLSYNGSINWKDFKRTVKIIKVSNSAVIEGQTNII